MSWIEILLASLPIAISIIVAAFAEFNAKRKANDESLRKDDVLKWSMEAIETLQALDLLSKGKIPGTDEQIILELRRKISLQTSALVGKGRLFFKIHLQILRISPMEFVLKY